MSSHRKPSEQVVPHAFVLPVIDLQRGVVVHGRGGRRAEYLPVEGVHGLPPTPEAIGGWFAESFDTAYVADLDAIEEGICQWNAYRTLVDCGLSLWLDAGIGSIEQARELVSEIAQRRLPIRLIVGLETARTPAVLSQLFHALTPHPSPPTPHPSPLFSLDLRGGRPLVGSRHGSAESWAGAAVAAGFRDLIVLDLATVGHDRGPSSLDLCRSIASTHSEVRLYLGGGIRDAADLQEAAAAGCHGVLVATALHAGRLDSSFGVGRKASRTPPRGGAAH